MARHFFGSQEAAQRRSTRAQARPVGLDGVHQITQPDQIVRTQRPLLTVEQARERLGRKSCAAVMRLVRDAGLPVIALGAKSHVFDQDDLDAWIAERRKCNTQFVCPK